MGGSLSYHKAEGDIRWLGQLEKREPDDLFGGRKLRKALAMELWN